MKAVKRTTKWQWKLPAWMRRIGTARDNVRKRYPKSYAISCNQRALLPAAGVVIHGATWQIWSSMDEHAKVLGEGATAKEAWLCAARGWEP